MEITVYQGFSFLVGYIYAERMAGDDKGAIDHAEKVPVTLGDRAKPGVFELPCWPHI